MGPRARIALMASAIAAVVALVIVSSGGGGADPVASAFPSTGSAPPTPLPARCVRELPAKTPTPPWFPDDLPLPPDSYTAEVLDGTDQVRVLNATVAASLDDFVVFLLEEWPAAGWEVGRGEREPGEAETTFSNDEVIGQLRARSVYCDPDATLVSFAIAARRAR